MGSNDVSLLQGGQRLSVVDTDDMLNPGDTMDFFKAPKSISHKRNGSYNIPIEPIY